MNMTSFSVSIVNGSSLLVSVLSSPNVTTDLTGTVVRCTDIGNSISYYTQYIVSIVGTLCGHNVSSTAVELNYGELLITLNTYIYTDLVPV